MRRIERENQGSMKPGQDLVIAGYAGWAGTVRAVEARRQELLARFTPAYLDGILDGEEIPLDQDLKAWIEAGATECEPAGEGGILTALWNISGAYMTGISFAIRKIPVKQATIEVCEYFDLNPYRLDSGGCLVLVSDNGGDLVSYLERRDVPAAVIGKVTGGIKRIIDHSDGSGEGQGYLDRPTEDEIYKILS